MEYFSAGSKSAFRPWLWAGVSFALSATLIMCSPAVSQQSVASLELKDR